MSDARVRPALRRTIGRHPGDLVRVAGSAAVVAGFAVLASATTVSRVESNVFQVFNELPDPLAVVLLPALQAGSAVGIAVAAGLAFFVRQLRLGVALTLGGTLAWLAVRAISVAVDRSGVAAAVADATVRDGFAVGAGFPSSHVAVVTALATVALPYVLPIARRATLAGVALVAAAAMFTAAALPLGVLVGLAVGWWAGATVNLLVGAPGRRVDGRLVADVLAAAGVEVEAVHRAHGRPWRAVEFDVAAADGRDLVARVVHDEGGRVSTFYQLRRTLASLGTFDAPGLASPQHEVQHEAYVTLLAERAGVRLPPVVLARSLPGGSAVLVTERVTATPLCDLDPEAVDEALLDAVWSQVGLLHRSRVAHHDLWPDAIRVDERGCPWLTRFRYASAAATHERLLQDVAELLAGVATLVGPERAVAAAARHVDRDRLADALPYLQPLALPRRVRTALAGHPEILAAVRVELAESLGVDPPDTSVRVSPSTVLGLLVAGGAVYVLLPQIGDVGELVAALAGADWRWLAVSFAAGMLTTVAAALSYWGSARRGLPLGKATAVQLASNFAGRLTPGGVGGVGLNLVFLERVGLDRREAVAAVALNTVGGFVVHAALFAGAVAVLGLGGIREDLEVPTGWPALGAVLAVLVVAGLALGTPVGRRRVVRPAREMLATLAETVRHPLRAAALFGGSAGVTAANAAAFVATVAAFGGAPASTLEVVAVYVGGSAIAAAAPTPGGLGAVEAALVAALTGIAMPSERAVAAVLSFRLLTFWLPILPGLVAYRVLRHRQVV